MTGFGGDEGRHQAVSWRWDIRSVNSRGLDVRLRLPPGYDALEPRLRERIGAALTRGSVSVSLNVSRDDGGAELRINEAALAKVLAMAERVRASGDFAPMSVEGLLGLRGIIEVAEGVETEDVAEARQAAMFASFERALAQLVTSRRAEGGRLAPVIEEHLASIQRLVDEIGASPARRPMRSARASRSRSRGCSTVPPRSTKRVSTRRRHCWRSRPTSRRSCSGCARTSRRRAR